MSFVGLLTLFLVFIGAAFALLGAIGILRMPDFYMRISSVTKASTLGAGAALLAAALHFGELGVASRGIATLLFLFLTGPIAAHRIARAAYFDNCPRWFQTQIDELRGRYDEDTHELRGPAPSTSQSKKVG